MSEKLRITCVCGYENWVSPEHLGETVSCMMCGADLAVDEAAAAGRLESADTDAVEYNDDESSPESPVNPPHRYPSPPDGITLEERVERERKKRGRPLSPFDAEDEEDEPPRASMDAGAREQAAPRQPKPRARNPFEADEPEEEKPAGRGPFTLEPASGPKGGTSLADLLEETRPKERRNRHVIIDTISPHDAPSGETCVQCGRAIRGSWDRVETEKGVICYVCSNQAVQGTPERLKTDKAERRELSERDLVVHEVEELPIEDEPWYKDPESPEFKRVVWFLAVFTLVLGAYFFFFDSGPDTAPSASSEQAARAPVDPVLWYGWRIASFFVSFVFAVYMALRIDDATPQGKLFQDVFFIAVLTVPITIVFFVLEAMRMLIAPVPIAGPVFYLLIPIARWLVIILFITRFIRMRFSQIVVAAVLHFMGVMLLRAIGQGIF